MIEPAGEPEEAYRLTAGNNHSKIEYDFKVKYFATNRNESIRLVYAAAAGLCESRTERTTGDLRLRRLVKSLTDPERISQSARWKASALAARRACSAGVGISRWWNRRACLNQA